MAKIVQDVRYTVTKGDFLETLNREIIPVLRALRKGHNLVNAEPVTLTENTTLTADYYKVLLDGSSNTVDVTLESLVDIYEGADQGVMGRNYWIKSIDDTHRTRVVGVIDGVANMVLAKDESIFITAGEDSWRIM